MDKVTVKFTEIPEKVIDHLVKVGEIFHASGSFTIGDRELGKYVEFMDGTLDAIEGRVIYIRLAIIIHTYLCLSM